jgi:hypothetical protein
MQMQVACRNRTPSSVLRMVGNGSPGNIHQAVSLVTAQCAGGRHPDPNETEGDTMRGYVTATGMAIGLLAIWAALLPFVA